MKMKRCYSINELCEDVRRVLKSKAPEEAHEISAAIINLVQPPRRPHASDCATSNAPAMMPSWCDCGACDRTHEEMAMALRAQGWDVEPPASDRHNPEISRETQT